MSNVQNLQTCAVGYLHLILPIVALMDGQAIEVAGEVIDGAGVEVPIGVTIIAVSSRNIADMMTIFSLIRMVEAIATPAPHAHRCRTPGIGPIASSYTVASTAPGLFAPTPATAISIALVTG